MKKTIIMIIFLTLILISGCATKDILIQGEVERIGDDFIIVNNNIYDLCDNEEDSVLVGDNISFITSGTGKGMNCNSELLEIKIKKKTC